ncbi:MAG: FAD-dependent oxidoreductase [Armatimonadota bacterium]
MNIAIVGAGIMGVSTTYACAKRGHEVTIFDQYKPGHTNGSSHGNSRIVRKAYPDPFYTEIMQEGYRLWQELQSQATEQILFETGLVYFGKRKSQELQQVTESLRANGVDQSIFNWPDFADLSIQEDEIGYVTKEAGWVHASRAVKTLLDLSEAKQVQQQISDPRELATDFDRVIVCAGAWAKLLFDLPVTVTRQTFAYVQTHEPMEGMVWIDDTYPMLYGFPSEPGRSAIKIGVHNLGDETDPNELGQPNLDHLEMIRTAATKRFGIQNPILQDPTTCLYTRTADEDFLLGEAANNVFWVSPCSGHGFKFGPWIGERLADLAEGKMHPRDIPRFNLS